MRGAVLLAALLAVPLSSAQLSAYVLNSTARVDDVPAPAAVHFASWTDYDLDTSAIDAPLVVLPDTHLCKLIRGAAMDAGVRGMSVLVPHMSNFCAETAYLFLVAAGAQAVVTYRQGMLRTAGGMAATRTRHMGTLEAVAQSTVVFVEVHQDAATRLRELVEVADAAGQPVHLTLRPSRNPWVELFDSWAWRVLMRWCAPACFLCVAALAVMVGALAEPVPVQWRSTRFVVMWIEMLPAALLAGLFSFGMYGSDGLLPRELQLFFGQRCRVCACPSYAVCL